MIEVVIKLTPYFHATVDGTMQSLEFLPRIMDRMKVQTVSIGDNQSLLTAKFDQKGSRFELCVTDRETTQLSLNGISGPLRSIWCRVENKAVKELKEGRKATPKVPPATPAPVVITPIDVPEETGKKKPTRKIVLCLDGKNIPIYRLGNETRGLGLYLKNLSAGQCCKVEVSSGTKALQITALPEQNEYLFEAIGNFALQVNNTPTEHAHLKLKPNGRAEFLIPVDASKLTANA